MSFPSPSRLPLPMVHFLPHLRPQAQVMGILWVFLTGHARPLDTVENDHQWPLLAAAHRRNCIAQCGDVVTLG
ncbi:MAG: hypothetical protein G5700_06375 [Serratia symbiotica]|nr:hypothetical protein [Serratia symbiotica]